MSMKSLSYLCMFLCLGGEATSPPEKTERRPESNRLEITLVTRPRTVYCGSLITAAIEGRLLETADEKDIKITWTASGGLIWFDDLAETKWRAPEKPTRVQLCATVSYRGKPLKQSISVDVRAPKTDGMIWIPPGKFLRGDIEGTWNTREIKTVQNNNDEPFHEVYVDGFWIDRYPVTNRQFAKYLGDALAQGVLRVEPIAVMGEFEGSWVPFYYFQPFDRLFYEFYLSRISQPAAFLHVISWDGKKFHVRKGHEDHPLVDVSWFGSAAYANFYGRMLPTEAQWERAARGHDNRRYPWGDNVVSAYHANVDEELTPVGAYSPQGDSPFGVADMVSPAFEWTNDWWNTDYYRDYFADTPHRNPTGPFWGSSHSIRSSPGALTGRTPSIELPKPVSRRYNWRFEYFLGDCFANNRSAFRTVVCSREGS